MHLKGADIFKAKALRRSAEMAGKLRHRVNVGSLRGRRQIADRHIFDHAPAKRAQLGHLRLLFSRLRFNSHNPSKQKRHPQTHARNAASAASFNPESQQTLVRLRSQASWPPQSDGRETLFESADEHVSELPRIRRVDVFREEPRPTVQRCPVCVGPRHLPEIGGLDFQAAAEVEFLDLDDA